tara:strand:+ start:1797 stop:2102 length:306 start_codon:yes stop_codon:yes gene_type:complete
MLNLINYLIVNVVVFTIGVLGIVLNRKNIIIIYMSIELMLFAVSLNFIVFSIYLDDIVGQIFTLYILTIAACESAIGLAILVSYYKVKGVIAVEGINTMKG